MAGGNPVSFRDLFDFSDKRDLRAAIKGINDLAAAYTNFTGIVTGGQLAQYSAQQAVILEQVKALQVASKDLNISNKESRKIYLDNLTAMGQLEAGMQRLNTAKQKAKQVDDSAADGVNGLKERLKELIAQYNKLSPAIETDSQQMQKLSVDIIATKNSINLLTSALKASVQEVVVATGSYDELDLETKKLVRDLNAMAGGLTDTSGRAKALREQIKANTATLKQWDSELGNNRRHVGDYARGFNGLQNAVVQVGREIPNFASDVRIGFLAISNNLPILQEEIQRTKLRNAELIAQGKPTVSVFKQITSAILSWQTALIIGVTILVQYGDEIVNASKRMLGFTVLTKEQIKAQKEYREALVNIEKESAVNTQKELTRMDALIAGATNLNKSQESRLRSALALQKNFPQYYNQLSAEEIIQGRLGDAYAATTKAIYAQAIAKGAASKLDLISARRGETDFNASQANKAFDDYVKTFEGKDANIRGKVNRFFSTFFDGNFTAEDARLSDYLQKSGINLKKLRDLKKDSEAATGIYLDADADLRKAARDYQKTIADATDPLIGSDAPQGSVQALREKIEGMKAQRELLKDNVEGRARLIQINKELIPLENELDRRTLTGKFSPGRTDNSAAKAENEAERKAKALRKAALDQLKAQRELDESEARGTFAASEKTIADEVALQDKLTEIRIASSRAQATEMRKYLGLTGEEREQQLADITEVNAEIQDEIADHEDKVDKIREKSAREDERRNNEALQQFEAEKRARKELRDLRLQEIGEEGDDATNAVGVANAGKNNNILGRQEAIQQALFQIRLDTIRKSIDANQAYIDTLAQDDVDLLDAERKSSELRKQLKREEADFIIAQEERKKQKQQDVINTSIDLAGQAAAVIVDFASTSSENQIQILEAQKEYELEIAGTNTDAKEAIEKKYQKKLIEERQRQANYEKATALFNIAVSGFVAAARALELGPIAGPIAAGIIGALAIAQGINVASKKVPQYRMGRGFGRDEAAEVNEAGPEPIVDRKGNVRFANAGRRGYTWLSKDEKVVPHHDFLRMSMSEYEDDSHMDKYTDSLLEGTKVYRKRENEQNDKIANAIVNSAMDRDILAHGIASGISGLVVQENHYDERGHNIYLRKKGQRVTEQKERTRIGGNG